MFSQDHHQAPHPSPLTKNNVNSFRTPELVPLKQKGIYSKISAGNVEINDNGGGFEMMAPAFSLKIKPTKNKSTGRDQFSRIKLRNDI